ncbi:Wzz/FepE/Etk N-terminal domain-containing protein [Pseudomonas synxantha]|uniref:Chain length determinant protein (Polysaccharide antigen chain regulator) n=1 Tax=Pseudomonas synxantha TaxID=47883 RepID=A0ACC6JH52_9PSED|nr:Wzz/FepE/Etk N-terminal domain-containing protein [Pseudomonas synxantha]MDR6605612.1 chain length determinant protein (polysaccharide antigen chain regulator) [Pseudomonas synxantha]
MHMQETSSLPAEANEIDLKVLAYALWRQRFIIIAITAVVTILAASFTFFSKPIYEAKVFVIPPTQNDIANYNYGRTVENELSPYTIKEVYGVFTRNLMAESLRREFFNNYYLPSLPESERSGSQDKLYAEFSKLLMVSLVNKESSDRYVVVAQDESAAKGVELVGKYIERASELAKKEIKKDIGSEADVLARNIRQQIASLRDVGLKDREDSIIKLREALLVAEAIGLDRPPIISGNSAVEIAGNLDGQLIYMRGTKALKAEIENLESRNSDDPFIKKLRMLQAKYDFYSSLESSILNVEVYRTDGVVELPDSPVKSQKSLYVLIGLIAGLILGVLVALIRNYLSSDGVRLFDSRSVAKNRQ